MRGRKKAMGKKVGGAKKKVGAKKFANTAGKKVMAKKRKK